MERLRLIDGWVIVTLGLTPLALGCADGPFDLVSTSGRVVFEDGEPLGVGQIVFSPLTPPVGEAHPRSALAYLKEDGTFDYATTFKTGDGIIVGQHKVSFIYATDESGVSLVPEQYTSVLKTPLTIDSADMPLTIKIPRP